MILEVASITGLTNANCQDLKCGDVVVENDNGSKTAYIVSVKTATTLSLSYVDGTNAKEVKYAVSNSAWSYDETITTALGGGGSDNTFIVTLTADASGEDVEFSQDKTNEEIYQALVDGKLVFINCDYHTWNGRVCLLSQQVTYGKVEEVAGIGDSTIEYTFYSPYDSNQSHKISFNIKSQEFVVLD